MAKAAAGFPARLRFGAARARPAPRLGAGAVLARAPLAALAVTFGLAQAAYGALGLRFDFRALESLWQFLDPELLRDRLAESLWYLHTQPPLFNLFAGVVLKAFGVAAPSAFHVIYVAFGFGLYAAVFALQRRLGVSRAVAYGVSTAFLVSPSFMLYENWLFYTFPLALMITASALLFHAARRGTRLGPVAGFFFIQFAMCATRSMFHLLYFGAVAGAVVFLAAGRRRAVGAIAVAFFALTFSLYAKNYVVFGKFTASTWFGTNLWAITGENLSAGERKALVAAGGLSDVAAVKRFSTLEKYPGRYHGAGAFESVPALSRVRRSTGFHNYNHAAYIGIAERNLEDSLYVLRRKPGAYVLGVAKAWFCYFKSASDFCFFEDNGSSRRVRPVSAAFDTLFYGKVPWDLTRLPALSRYSERPQYVYLFLLIGLPALVFFGAREALRRGPPTADGPNREQRLTLLYVVFVVAYVAVMANMFGAQENNRYRFMTEPLYVVLLGLVIARIVARIRRRRGRVGEEGGAER